MDFFDKNTYFLCFFDYLLSISKHILVKLHKYLCYNQ